MLNTRKDNEVRELEGQLEDITLKLENQPFEIEFKVQQELSSKIQQQLMKDMGSILESEQEVASFEESIQKFMAKYTNQENQIQKLRDEMTQLTTLLKQNEFQISHARLNQLGE